MIYNGQKYYECGGNFLESNYDKLFAYNDVFPKDFPHSIIPYETLKTIDLSICVEFLPELEKGQKYTMPKDRYFIYSNDSITHPTIIYIYEDSSYREVSNDTTVITITGALPEGAEVTRFAPSPTGFLHIGGLFGSLIDIASNSV